jgi:hypothetical protein
VHLARAILAEFAENMGKLVAERGEAASPHPNPPPLAGEGVAVTSGATVSPPPQAGEGLGGGFAASNRAPPAALSGTKILWRAFTYWLRQLFGKGHTR